MLTPCIVSVFPLSRVIERGNFHSTGINRFIATPVPVPLRRNRLNGSFDVACSYSDRMCPRVSAYARIAPLPLFGSMLSETPGARPSLSFNVCGRMACALVETISRHPIFTVLGATCQIQGSTLHLAELRLPKQSFRAVGSTLPGKASDMLKMIYLSFTVMAQSLVTQPVEFDFELSNLLIELSL